MSYLSKRLKKQDGISVYNSIIKKNTNPTTESMLSFTEREFSRCFADIKFKIENTRFENGYLPYTGEQFLEDLDDETQNKHQFIMMKANPNGSTLNQLDNSDLRHLDGKPFPNIIDIRDKKEVESKFKSWCENNYYPLTVGYDENRCDKSDCTTCPPEEQIL